MNEYHLHLGILIGLYLILAHGMNLVFGAGKMLNLAHVAAYAIGAYATAILSTDPVHPQPTLVCMGASVFFAALLALLLGAIASRLSEEYFAIGTLAFSAIVSALLVNWKSLTRGVLGIPGIPRPSIAGIEFDDNRSFFLLTSTFAGVALVFVFVFLRSSFARALRAQAENGLGATALGVSARNVRNDTFIVASGLAGLAGSLFAYYMSYIDPSSFALHEMVFVLGIVIVGRPGSFWGITVATVALVLLPEQLRRLDLSASVLGPMRQLLHALILFAVVYWNRARIFPEERSV